MFAPELAMEVGYNLGHVVSALIFSAYIIARYYKERDPKRLWMRSFMLFVFLSIVKATDYYSTVFIGGELAILGAVVAIYYPELREESEYPLLLAAMIYTSTIVYYVKPLLLVGTTLRPLSQTGVLSKLTVVYSLITFTLVTVPAAFRARRKGEFSKNFKYGIGLLSLLGTLILVLYLLRDVSHIYYGIAIQLYAVYLQRAGVDGSRVAKVFLAGLLIALDDIIAYNLYPAYAEPPLLVYRALIPAATLINALLLLRMRGARLSVGG